MRNNVRMYACEWHSPGDSHPMDVFTFGEPLHPLDKWWPLPPSLVNWTSNTKPLDGLFLPADWAGPHKALPFFRVLQDGPVVERRLSNCSRGVPVPDPGWSTGHARVRNDTSRKVLLFMNFRIIHTWQRPSHDFQTPQQAWSYAQQSCAHYRVVGELMAMLRPVRPQLVLDYSAEWPHFNLVNGTEQLVASCHIEPSQVTFLHFNVGMLLPLASHYPPRDVHQLWREFTRWSSAQTIVRAAPAVMVPPALRMRQAYFHFYQARSSLPGEPESIMNGFPERYELCDATSNALRERVAARIAAPQKAPFLLLGGSPRNVRGFAMFELWRRGVLQRSRFSSLRYEFCNVADPSTFPAYYEGPFSPEYIHDVLLRDVASLRRFCATLPRILDGNPNNKSHTVASVSHELWADTSFGVIFDSSMPDFDSDARLSFTTEKTTKPLGNLRPFVLLGAAGGLAILRSLGFRTFSPLINETYDTMPRASDRIRFAIDEIERLSALPPTDPAWATVIDVIVHNARHLACGGLSATYQRHAHAIVQRGLDR